MRRGRQIGRDEASDEMSGPMQDLLDSHRTAVLDQGMLCLSLAEGYFSEWWGGSLKVSRNLLSGAGSRPQDGFEFECLESYLTWAMLRIVLKVHATSLRSMFQHEEGMRPSDIGRMQLLIDYLRCLDRPWPYGARNSRSYNLQYHPSMDGYCNDTDLRFALSAEYVEMFRRATRADPSSGQDYGMVGRRVRHILKQQYGNRFSNWSVELREH